MLGEGLNSEARSNLMTSQAYVDVACNGLTLKVLWEIWIFLVWMYRLNRFI